MDFDRAEVRRDGKTVVLATREFKFIRYLVQNRGRVIPREETLGRVWRDNKNVMSRTIDVHIRWLRQKLDRPEHPQHIQTVRGRGYLFVA